MRKITPLAVLGIAVLSLGVTGAQSPPSCAAVNPGNPTCTIHSIIPSSFIAAGDWIVKVYWDGTCDGSPDWIRASEASANVGDPTTPSDGPGNNLIPDVAGAWKWTVAQAGYCAEAEALSEGSAVLIGADPIPELPEQE